jgi:hypothetical protein
MTFPRKIVLTNEYGSSFFQNLRTNLVLSKVNPYDIIESPALVEAATNRKSWAEARQDLITEGFPEDQIDNLDHWGWSRMGHITVRVHTVNGPYIVEDYEGKEYVIEKDAIQWRL